MVERLANRFNIRSAALSLGFSACFSLAIAAPNWATEVWSRDIAVIAAVGIFFLSSIFMYAVLVFLKKSSFAYEKGNRCLPAFAAERMLIIFIFTALELASLMVLLSNYPGFCTTDSNDIVAQALGTSSYADHHRYDGLSNHHPVFYTFLVWVALKITAGFGDVQFGVFCFSLFQLSLVNVCITWAVCWLNRHTASKPYVAVVAAFFLFSPVLMAQVAIMWKDIPFSALILVLTLFLYDFSRKERHEAKEVIKLFLLLFFLTLLRNNGIYIAVGLLFCMILVLRETRKALLKCSAVFIAAILVIQGPLFSSLSIEKGHFSESVGIPLQQVARTISHDGCLTSEQEQFLNQVLPMEMWAEEYRESSPNRLKFSKNFDDAFLESHKLEFLAVWAEMMPANLAHYVKAWILETRGYWEPGYLGWIGTDRTLNGEEPRSLIGIEWNPSEAANALGGVFPVLYSMGSYIWVILTALLVFLVCPSHCGKARGALCFVPVLLLFGTLLIAAPIASDFRYVFSLYLLIPFTPAMAGLLEKEFLVVDE